MRSKVLLRSVLVAVAALAAAMAGPAAQAAPAPEARTSAAVEAGAHEHAGHADHGAHVEHGDHAGHGLGEGHGITAEELAAEAPALPVRAAAWPVPTDRSYYLTSSCSAYAGVIAQGASVWANLDRTSGSGTPVECRNSYITDCGGGGRIVGCNWGRGQRIALYMGGVNDDALLAAHEFGHDWYGHSSYQCAGWSSPSHVMAPSICNFAGAKSGEKSPVRID